MTSEHRLPSFDSKTEPTNVEADRADEFVLEIVMEGHMQRRTFKTGGIVVGRSRDTDLKLDHASISRRHALVHLSARRIIVQDFGSQNGTRVRGVVLAPRVPTVVALGEPFSVGAATITVVSAPEGGADAGNAERVAVTSLEGELAIFERRQIIEALAACGGNQTKAAKVLEISRRTLVSRLSEYGIPRPKK